MTSATSTTVRSVPSSQSSPRHPGRYFDFTYNNGHSLDFINILLGLQTIIPIDIYFISVCQKAVLDIYQEEQAKVPGYIKNLDAVLREYYPTLVSKEREVMESFTTDKYEQTYNAFENDIAVLNVYFGQPTTTEYIR